MSAAGGLPDSGGSLLRAIIDALPELVFVLDREGTYVAVLGGRDDARYHDGSDLVGRRMHDVLPPELADAFLDRIGEALDGDRVVTYEYRLSQEQVEGVERREGVPDELWFEARVAPLARDDGRDEMVVWMLFNVTTSRVALQQLEEQQHELERLARTDELTGLLNRRSFFELAARELAWVRRTDQPAALVTFDLDDFKHVNDTHGHAAGDAVLRRVGALLHATHRTTDLQARIGGEEFALVSRDATLEQAHAWALRLRDALSQPGPIGDGRDLAVTASFGVTDLRRTDDDPDTALRRADAALYRAKQRGRDRVEVSPALSDEA